MFIYSLACFCLIMTSYIAIGVTALDKHSKFRESINENASIEKFVLEQSNYVNDTLNNSELHDESELGFDFNDDPNDDPNAILNNLKMKNRERIVIGHLNINHLENKFEPLASLIKNRLDIFLLTETKLDQTFTSGQFKIDGFANPFRRDRDKYGGGLLLYIRDRT